MSKDASQFPVTFGFGATTVPYSKTQPHQGEDRKMPAGTPVCVNGQIIGLSGNSGKSTGAHLHIQRVGNGKVIPPLGGGFSLPKPVVVTDAGFNNTVGNYIRLKDGNGETWSYFHLYEIKVTVGQQIGEDMLTNKQIDEIILAAYVQIKGAVPGQNEWDFHRKQFKEQGIAWIEPLLKGFKGDDVAWKKYERNLKDANKTIEQLKSGVDVRVNGKKFIPEDKPM